MIINVILCSTFIPVRICKLRPRTSCSETFWLKCVGANQVRPIKLSYTQFFFSLCFILLSLDKYNAIESVRMIIVNPDDFVLWILYKSKHVKWIRNTQKAEEEKRFFFCVWANSTLFFIDCRCINVTCVYGIQQNVLHLNIAEKKTYRCD